MFSEMHTAESILAFVTIVCFIYNSLEPTLSVVGLSSREMFAAVVTKMVRPSHLPCGSFTVSEEMFLPSSHLSISAL